MSMLSIAPLSFGWAFLLLLYPRFLFIINSTRDNSSRVISSVAAFARRRSVSNVVFEPFAQRTVSGDMNLNRIKLFISSFLLCLYLERFSLMPWANLLFALVVMGFPFSKFVFSSVVKGFTRTPSFKILDVSVSFSFSWTTAHPMLVEPRSKQI